MVEAQALIRLQEIDLKLLRLKGELEAMPQQKKLQAIKLALKKVAAEITKTVGLRKDVESDIEELETNLAHYHDKTEEVKLTAEERAANYRQIRDLEAQLSHLAKRIEKTEFELVPLRERLAELQEAEREALAMQERLKAEGRAQTESFEHDTAELKREAVSLIADRKAVLAALSKDAIARYEVARERFKGFAVERLVGNVPSTCRVKLQPSIYTGLVRGPIVTECPYCHRILVTRDPEEE